MIKKLRTIVLGTVAIAAVIALFATGPEVGQVWSQVANAQPIIVIKDEIHEKEIHENNGEIANHIKAPEPEIHEGSGGGAGPGGGKEIDPHH
jgi:hypothetical protein